MRKSRPLLLLRFAAAGLGALLAGCREEGRLAAYRPPAADSARTVVYEVSLEGEAEGFRGARAYSARAFARLDLKAAPETSEGRLDLVITADTVAFSASDRDGSEGLYMVERLRRYKARLALDPSGRMLALEEEPELPPVDFSPLNFGRFLAYALPAFPAAPVRAGDAWNIEQPLLDKFHPSSRVVKRFKAASIRESPAGRVLVCTVEMEAWLEEGLGASPQGASAEAAPSPALTGRGEAEFDLDRGRPLSSSLRLQGRLVSRLVEGPADSARTVDLPLRLGLQVDLRFEEG